MLNGGFGNELVAFKLLQTNLAWGLALTSVVNSGPKESLLMSCFIICRSDHLGNHPQGTSLTG